MNMLTPIRKSGSGKRRAFWLCRCACGNVVERKIHQVRSGHTWNCGCKRRASDKWVTHGFCRGGRKSPTYRVWSWMKARCDDPNNKSFPNYGGRGIKYVKRWAKFENFVADMGERPSPLHSIERKNNNGPYSKANCRWATKTEQANNRRNSQFIEYDGRRQTQKQWSQELGIPLMTIRNRLAAKMPLARVFSLTKLSLKKPA